MDIFKMFIFFTAYNEYYYNMYTVERIWGLFKKFQSFDIVIDIFYFELQYYSNDAQTFKSTLWTHLSKCLATISPHLS